MGHHVFKDGKASINCAMFSCRKKRITQQLTEATKNCAVLWSLNPNTISVEVYFQKRTKNPFMLPCKV